MVSLWVPYHAFIVSLHLATFAELTASCEGSVVGVALVSLWFPYGFSTMDFQWFPHEFLTMPLLFLYSWLHLQNFGVALVSLWFPCVCWLSWMA